MHLQEPSRWRSLLRFEIGDGCRIVSGLMKGKARGLLPLSIGPMLPDDPCDCLRGCSLKKTDAANPIAVMTTNRPMQKPAPSNAVRSMNIALACPISNWSWRA